MRSVLLIGSLSSLATALDMTVLVQPVSGVAWISRLLVLGFFCASHRMSGGVVLSALAMLAVILSMMVSPSTGGGATSVAAFANAGFVAGRVGDAVAGVRLLFLQTDST